MKDSKEKLELLLKCYQGKHDPRDESKQTIINPRGFGNMLQSFTLFGRAVLNDVYPNKYLNQMKEAYEYLISQYETIPFDELDPNDLDFVIFFESEKLIKELKPVLTEFYKSPSKQSLENIRDLTSQPKFSSEETDKLRVRIVELHEIYG